MKHRNSEFFKDISKSLNNIPSEQRCSDIQGRRYIPECGIKKHNERIHRESKLSDHHSNLPFTFRKPYKPKGINSYIKCDNCGYITSGTVATVGVICNSCKKFSSVSLVS